MIAPIWPTFLTNIVGLNVFQVGVVDGLALTITSLSKLGAGYSSDRTGKRKAFITVGYLLSVIGRLGFLITYGFYHILFWKSTDRLGKIRGPPRDAIVAAEASEKRRGRAFGILRALDTAGAVLGAVITYLLFSYLGYFGIIFLAALPSIGSVIVVAVLIKEKRGKDVFKGVTFRGLNKNLKLFFVASVLFALGTYSYSFLMLYSEGFGYGEEVLPLLYILFTLVYALSAYPFGIASDSFGRKPVLLLAFLLLMLTSFWTILVTDQLTVVPLFILFGLMNGALDPVQTSLVADLVEEKRRASIIGAFQLAIGITALPAGFIMGFLWETYTPILAFQFSFVMVMISIIVLLLVKTKHKES
jgi:MFS family permease